MLLYSENAWEHPKDASETWRANKNMQGIIYGKAWEYSEAVSGTDYAVCYLDLQRGNGSNASWRTWFPTDADTIFNGSDRSTITFFGPSMQFPYTTHYTVIASAGQVYDYADRAGAIEGFSTLPPREVDNGSQVQVVFPQFCYYHEVVCPSGVYRLEFFGPRMDEQGYKVK